MNEMHVFDVTIYRDDGTRDTYTIVAPNDKSARAKAVKIHNDTVAYCTIEHVREVDAIAD